MKNIFNLFALRLALVVALLCAFSGAMGAPSSGPTPIDAPQNEHSIVVITDICGNKYNVVKIGKQLWMAENMRCNKYDTESERAGATVPLPRVTNAYYPYYQVYPSSGTNQAGFNGKLLSRQIPYLGTFFSWAAAVGFANDTEALSQTTPFKNRRQGICPNGWHLPTTDEWHELVDFIELTDGKGEGTAGKHLKTKQGWHNDKNGLDTYGFSALPADRADMSGTYGVGGWGKWWTSDAISDANVSTVQVYYGGDNFMFGANEIKAKSHALCVRCIKNPEKFEVKFVNYDGTELQSGEVEYGSLPEYTGETPTKDATAQYTYTFSGWSPEVVMVTEAATYTAQYGSTVNKYVIRFLDENGEVLQSGEVAYGSTPAYTGETPTKQATAQYTYNFNSWDSEITEVTGAKDYTATYTATTNKYIVRFLDEDGTELQKEELEYGATPAYKGETPIKQATAQYTYTFNGWNSEITDVTGAKDYTATYTPTTNKYVVRFLNEDGTELQSGEVEYGQTPGYSGATPEKAADAEFTYTFSGWSPEITSVTGAQTYTAQYGETVNKYVVRFLNEDGTELQSEELDYGATPAYTGETPTKQATAQYTYTFNGWDSEIAEVTGAKDYTATYTSTTNKYLITFENYNGEELQSSDVEYGQTPSYTGETPEKPADAENTYIFTGWSPEITSVTSAQTYAAQFSSTTNKYTVRFLNEDGAELQSEELAYGTTPVYAGATPTKQATAQYTYMFSGWDSEIVEVTGAKDYTATYTSTVNKYPIAFVNFDGFELQITPVEYGQTPVYTSITPWKPADAEFTYTFSGWSPEITEVTGAQTYTAQFSSTVNKYVVRFLNEDGTELQSEEIEYGATPVYTGETPTKQETAKYTYTFKGWDSDIEVVKGAKDYTATYTATPVHQTADNTPECANAPAVAKYDWLLMVNANAIKDMGYNLNENIVEWYRVVGEMDNLDSGERDDEKVGTGYYYTINSNLNSTGDYYALIDLPWQTSEVGCNGLMRTVVFHYAPKGSTKRAMAVSPTIAYPQQEIEVRDLPQEVAEVYVYDVAGRLYRSFRTNGEATAMFNAEQNAGTYIVVVWTSKGKETFKYIVKKR